MFYIPSKPKDKVNQNQTKMKISMVGTREFSVEIYSIVGTKILSPVKSGSATYNISQLTPGVYFVKINSKGKFKMKKIILFRWFLDKRFSRRL